MLNGRESAFRASVLFNQNRTKPHFLTSRSFMSFIQYFITHLTLNTIDFKHSSFLTWSLAHSTKNFISLSLNIFNQSIWFNQDMRFTHDTSENTTVLHCLYSFSFFNLIICNIFIMISSSRSLLLSLISTSNVVTRKYRRFNAGNIVYIL